MRPVDKGSPPKVYTHYGDARHDLAKRIGYYCSYCEMKVFNSIEVEHILPQNQNGAMVDWDNFLLSCKYCNTIKSDHNDNLKDYVWPDRDNTDLAFEYSITDVIKPKCTLHQSIKDKAQASIDLMGLDRLGGGLNIPTQSDTRWRSRKEAWDIAKKSYTDWLLAPISAMARQIARTSLNGHYSIWCEVFKDEQEVLMEIDAVYLEIALYKQFDADGITRIIRHNGQL